MNDYQIEQFMRASNAIEGEKELGAHTYVGKLHHNDIMAAKDFLSKPMNADSLKELHKRLGVGRDILLGDWRKVGVQVAKHVPPAPKDLDAHMESFFRRLHIMDSWNAHNNFEHIHPFEDLNGRTGRLIWLHKRIKELGHVPRLSFLHSYYYQTLNHYQVQDAKIHNPSVPANSDPVRRSIGHVPRTDL